MESSLYKAYVHVKDLSTSEGPTFHPLLAKAGLPSIRFHDLRHSTATLLFTLGTHPKIVQELLGHSQIYTTLDIYSHVLPTLQEAAIQRLEELLSPLQGKQDQ